MTLERRDPGRSIKRVRRLSIPQPKPCPTCLAPMRQIKVGYGYEWRCETHGKPTRP